MQPARLPHRSPLVLLLALLTAPPALANQGWEGNIGAGAIYGPDYLGSDDYETQVWPALSVTYGDRFYFSLREGLGWNVIRQGDWRVSPFIGYTQGRDDDDDLRRLEEVDGGATAGLRIVYTAEPWTYSATVQSPFTGDVDGFEASFEASWRKRINERWSAAIGPEVTYSSADWTEDIFGISPGESARSGLSAYDPEDGYFRVGVRASVSYWLTPEWSVTGLAGVSQLTGDAEDSPIVDDIGDATQTSAGAFIRYRF